MQPYTDPLLEYLPVGHANLWGSEVRSAGSKQEGKRKNKT